MGVHIHSPVGREGFFLMPSFRERKIHKTPTATEQTRRYTRENANEKGSFHGYPGNDGFLGFPKDGILMCSW